MHERPCVVLVGTVPGWTEPKPFLLFASWYVLLAARIGTAVECFSTLSMDIVALVVLSCDRQPVAGWSQTVSRVDLYVQRGVMHTFELQDSCQTLAQALAEYYAANPGLAKGRAMSLEAQHFFRCHDTVHVIFGCSTKLDDEATVKIASIFGTTAGLNVLKGYNLYESRQIYWQLAVREVLRSITHSVIVVPRTILRCRAQRARWPWDEFDQYLQVPLQDIRRQFGITVAHG